MSSDAAVPKVWTSCQDIDFKAWIVVSDAGDRGVREVSASTNSDLYEDEQVSMPAYLP